MKPRVTLALAVSASAVVALTGCGSSGSGSGGSSSSTSSSSSSAAVSGTTTVLAAASLKEAFTTIAADFERANPGAKVVLSFGPSSGLASQIAAGSPADVFASASQKNMDSVTGQGLAAGATPFAKNVLEIAVPPANPGGVASVADLAKSSVKVAVCQAQVPCGTVAAKVFSKAKITAHVVSQEVDVKAVLTKVQLGEVDAGLVYVTDVRAAGSKVKGVPIPATVNASTTYPIAALTKAPNSAGAGAFVAYVLSPAGQKVLQADGFAAP